MTPAGPRWQERARRNRRIVSIAMILSVSLHALAVVLSPLLIRYLEPDSLLAPPRPLIVPRSDGTEVVQIRITDIPPVQPERRTPQPEPEPELEAIAGVEETDAFPMSAAERLRPRVGDWRLWVLPPLARRDDRTPAERTAEVNERLNSIIGAINDSALAAEIRAAEAMDWTVGGEGNKWGVSPGKLHLGPITLPFPITFGPTREEAATRAEWEAIQRQAGQAGVDEVFDDRVKAIRERREREKAKQDSTSNR